MTKGRRRSGLKTVAHPLRALLVAGRRHMHARADACRSQSCDTDRHVFALGPKSGRALYALVRLHTSPKLRAYATVPRNHALPLPGGWGSEPTNTRTNEQTNRRADKQTKEQTNTRTEQNKQASTTSERTKQAREQSERANELPDGPTDDDRRRPTTTDDHEDEARGGGSDQLAMDRWSRACAVAMAGAAVGPERSDRMCWL
jgi:hypothetical protein